MGALEGDTRELIRRHLPARPVLGNAVRAFLVGGSISVVGQVILSFFENRGLARAEAGSAAAATMIFLGSVLTGLGVYDRLGRQGGMGAFLPITGFANAVTAPAMEFKREGFVLGVGARLFTVAGPVIVYALASSLLVGIVLWMLGMTDPGVRGI
ncbi:MAG TPA: SpoVA/SpoVAEb family sporulation membrane protein [Bacillota bacterium]|nr:SpoVA/SpoVAEb family sporulation membrane protein [Bacillota bacterium]